MPKTFTIEKNEKAYILSRSLPVTESGCWLWTGNVSRKGYGVSWWRYKKDHAHRSSYRTFVGEIVEGSCVLHRCDVRCCVNPEHLFLGSNADNVADKVRKSRQARGESCGKKKLTEERVREILSSGESGRSMARKFGVSESLVSAVRRRVSWGHVTCQ